MKLNTYFTGVAALLLSLCFFSCKKETKEIPYPFTQIKSFTVPVAGSDSLSVAVDNSALTLYWPGTSAIPDSIAPVITVSDKATILPASGTKVALKDGLTYTVKAQDGTTVTYTLKLVNNQAQPQINDESPLEIDRYTELNVNGRLNYIIPDFNRTKGYVIDAAGKEILLPTVNLSRNGVTLYADATNPAETLAPGNYKLKLVSGDKSVTSTTAFITINQSTFKAAYIFNAGPAAWTAKRGTTTTLPVRNFSGNSFNAVVINGREVEIVGPSADGNGLVVKIPADFQIGSFYTIETYTYNAATDNYPYTFLTFSAPITITE
jgi:hypothetical protein